jgi:hypothetical protein
MVSPFVTKLVLMPLIIAMVTWVSRKWGNTFGGTLASLPWVAAPIFYFIAIEQGRDFALDSIPGVMVGIIAWLLFCFVYIVVGIRYNAFISLVIGYIVYLGIGKILLPIIPSLSLNMWVLCCLLAYVLVLKFTPLPVESDKKEGTSFKLDIPLRMIVVTLFVVVITYFADKLGSDWSGILTPSPVITAVLAIFVQQAQGIKQVRNVFFGLFVGTPGFTLFLYLQVFLLPNFPILVSFMIAACVEILAILVMKKVFDQLKLI